MVQDYPRPVGGATVSRHLHRPVTVGTRHVADAMIAVPHCHLALAETTIDGTTFKVVTVVIVASHPPRGAVSSTQRLALEDATP